MIRARRELGEIQDRLGYTRSTTTMEVATVNFRTISISGGVFHAPVTIADRIERTVITATSAPTAELAAVLTNLAEAVATMSAALPEDEAELAAHDLEEITNLATSGENKPARWRRAIDGLLSAAKRAADAGARSSISLPKSPSWCPDRRGPPAADAPLAAGPGWAGKSSGRAVSTPWRSAPFPSYGPSAPADPGRCAPVASNRRTR